MSKTVDESEQIKGGRAGNPEAWQAVTETHHADVYRYLLSLTRSVSDAEDLTQETFLRFYRTVRRFKGNCGLRTWLHRLAFTEFRLWHRKKRPQTEELPDTLQDQELDPMILAVLDEVAQLPVGLQAAFSLVELQGFSISEAAQALKIPQGTVKSRLHNAKKSLRKTLQGTEDHGQQPAEI